MMATLLSSQSIDLWLWRQRARRLKLERNALHVSFPDVGSLGVDAVFVVARTSRQVAGHHVLVARQ